MLITMGLDQAHAVTTAIMAQLDTIRAHTGYGNDFLLMPSMHIITFLNKDAGLAIQSANEEYAAMLQETRKNVKIKNKEMNV